MPKTVQSSTLKSPSFAFLASHDPRLVQYAVQAEKYVFDDPNTSLIKLRQFIEVLAQQSSAYAGLFSSTQESLVDLLDRLRTKGVLSPDVAQLFHCIRKAGNLAVHSHTGSQGDALSDPLGLAKRTDTGEQGRFRKFDRQWIRERGDSLDIS